MKAHTKNGERDGSRWRHRLTFGLMIVLVISMSLVAWRGARAWLRDGEPEAVRIHVVPHSDSADDQQLKLRVRDALRPELEHVMRTAPQGEAWRPHLDRLRAAARDELRRAGSDQSVAIVVVGDRRGEPTAIRIVLGDGGGANWFCVLVPPLCFADLEPIEHVAPPPDVAPEEGGVRIGWKWFGRLFGDSRIPVERVGDVDQDDVHSDFAHAAPRDGDVGLATE